MEIKASLRAYEVNGVEPKSYPGPPITLRSHGLFNDRLVIEVDGTSYTIIARQLESALRAVTGWVR